MIAGHRRRGCSGGSRGRGRRPAEPQNTAWLARARQRRRLTPVVPADPWERHGIRKGRGESGDRRGKEGDRGQAPVPVRRRRAIPEIEYGFSSIRAGLTRPGRHIQPLT